MSDEVPKSLANVKHIILILSGKGGVGKSSVTTQTALTLALKGYSVGVLDIDLTGPSLPRMFGVETKQVRQSAQGWVPVRVYTAPEDSRKGSILLMLLGFLLGGRDSSVVWRGPKKTAMVRQFLKDTVWSGGPGLTPLDYLLIDTPPGTLDEHIAIAEELRWAQPLDGAIIVTTPQQVATADVRKEINFCRKVNFNVLGVVENMSGFICPYCADCTNIFLSGGGQALSESLGLDFLGKIPIDPSFVEMIEMQDSAAHSDKKLLDMYETAHLRPVMGAIVDKVLAKGLPSRLPETE
ncbi:P-loop containing nucleoside triphosphate hydrolase protein [Metschnikowia bicuspidata var. bicuspidata NRRL YB-4993]|uniref:p-loop containing nucleoside triphosphate hydrolase protein n=1 Tax=Metschnikowia bicuspidata var. bicuspidata NRRL YB-4993 TaxID=869754 RepID=A0A1A0HHQ6_9ASCO|nr:P-loop containing nucleoside triphosphate hydrolase protein [Metschnikowia bicuspidata var. bicuspidata NRRL YB-4993]OBA23540.1 P-loop containing nucleoside triphosphate hydrolase protein [Metschnikowia bicuspidata var. bicuspidata NRRL YB-4993]